MAYLGHSYVDAMKASVRQRLQSKRAPNFYATLQAKYCIMKMQAAQVEWGLR